MTSPCSAVRASCSVSEEVDKAIHQSLDRCLTETNLPFGQRTVVCSCPRFVEPDLPVVTASVLSTVCD